MRLLLDCIPVIEAQHIAYDESRFGWVADGTLFEDRLRAYTLDDPEGRREAAKAARQAAVDAITVTTTTGKTFDGDETSQTRMARAIVAMQAVGATNIGWTLADNTTTSVTLAELTEALVLAGQEQARLWVL